MYPAVKAHLLTFGMERLEQTGKEYIVNGQKVKARKKTNNKWFETQDSISYWDYYYLPNAPGIFGLIGRIVLPLKNMCGIYGFQL